MDTKACGGGGGQATALVEISRDSLERQRSSGLRFSRLLQTAPRRGIERWSVAKIESVAQSLAPQQVDVVVCAAILVPGKSCCWCPCHSTDFVVRYAELATPCSFRLPPSGIILTLSGQLTQPPVPGQNILWCRHHASLLCYPHTDLKDASFSVWGD